jgi:hypothetical protein
MNKIIIIVALIVIVAIVVGVVVLMTTSSISSEGKEEQTSDNINSSPPVGTPAEYANEQNIPTQPDSGTPPISPPPTVSCPVVDRQTSVSVCSGYVYENDSDCNAQCGQCSNKIKLVTDNSNGGKTNPCSVARTSPVYIGCGYGYFDKASFDKQCGKLSSTGKWIGDSLPKSPASYIRYSSRNNFMSY